MSSSKPAPRRDELRALLGGLRASVGPSPGERVAALRQRLGLTQAALAGQFGVTARTVRRWESGRIPLSPAMQRLLVRLEETAQPKEGPNTDDQAAAERPAGRTYCTYRC